MAKKQDGGPARDSALRRRTVAAFRKWLKAHKVPVLGLSHVYPRCYVLTKVAPDVAIIARPMLDAEVQIKRLPAKFQSPVEWVRQGELSALNAGDWCACAYVSTPSSGEPYVISAVE